MAELQGGNHFFVQPISSLRKIGVVKWLSGNWHFDDCDIIYYIYILFIYIYIYYIYIYIYIYI